MIHMAKTSYSFFNKIKISFSTCSRFPLSHSIIIKYNNSCKEQGNHNHQFVVPSISKSWLEFVEKSKLFATSKINLWVPLATHFYTMSNLPDSTRSCVKPQHVLNKEPNFCILQFILILVYWNHRLTKILFCHTLICNLLYSGFSTQNLDII